MRRRKKTRELQRSTRFETFEERLALSAQPVGDFLLEAHTGGQLEHHYGELAPAEPVSPGGDFNLNLGVTSPTDGSSQGVQTQLAEAHELTGVNDVYNTYGFDGAGQTVAIIDSGIAYDHVALGGGFGTSYRVVGGWDFAENDANPYDDGPAGFHGTHVAGIVGSDNVTHRGVASGADLVALRVFDDDGAGYFSWVEDALQWVHNNRDAFENPITTVNLSLGTSWNADSIPSWAMLEDEFSQLELDGIFISVSAGNSFEDYNAPGLSYPAASPYVVPVASVDDTGLLSYFSQRNDRVLAAPGRSITSTVPDYIFGADGNPNDFGTASGTSMAAPYTAGASVLVRQAMEFVGIQNITQDTIYDHLRATADVFHDTATNADYHRINVQAALDALMPGDDFGSTVATAHSLGTVSGATSLSGLIGTLDDIDYFTFTAGATGTATFTVDPTSGLGVESDLVGGGTHASGNAITFDVTGGESYTLFVRGEGGLGSYAAQLNLEAIAVSEPTINATAVLDATTWNGSEDLARAAHHGAFFGDDFVSVDLTGSYELSGWARSGNDEGGQYQANNRQYFGFSSYDIDRNAIRPYHVGKFDGAADTRLAQTLRAGDTQIVLEDASGWNNAGAAHQRSLAWYGYADSTGHVYEDYTYTRNVKVMDVWDVGAIDYQTNTITLQTPWDGPELSSGAAVRNAQSGGTYNYAALAGSVSNDWTQYQATISGVSSTDAASFRPGTAYIKPLLLTNYHGQDGNLVTWKDVEVRPGGSFAGGGQVDLSVAALQMPNVTYTWTQLSGPAVEILNANSATASFTTPNQLVDSELSFQINVSDGNFQINDTIDVSVAGNNALVNATAVLDATTWNGSEDLARAAHHGAFFGDDFVSVDLTGSYELSGWARSGNDEGGQYQANNRQYFGFSSYDIDRNAIRPYHVGKFDGAADTRLAQTLRAGDTQIVLEDASGWNNAGAAHQRSLAWYGYADSTGHVYEDYTYTRNVKVMDVWDVGAIDYQTNTITLQTPWDGPELSSGAAVRNAQSGGTYNYAALAGSVSNDWTQYQATISGVSSTDAASFRPGTAYIKPLLLTNYHGQDGNLVTWKDVEVRPGGSFAGGGQVDLSVAALQMPNVTYTWTQLSGPAVEILNANSATASFTTPNQLVDSELSFQINVSDGNFQINDTIDVSVAGNNALVNATAVLDATTWNGSEDLARAAHHGAFFGDDFVSVDLTGSYELSGWARSGNDEGGQYQANNRQYFGFSSYDIDRNAIRPYHVGKFDGAADTRLAQTLRAGDTQIVLEDASGWNNAGAAHQRSLAWYGYADSTGHVYEDYTYTRNVKVMDVWDVGAIDYQTNTITLQTPWDGPELSSGAAVRNAQSGGTYNYAALAGSVSNDWTQYQATISGVSSTDAASFRPGTAYIKPLLLTNYHGQDGNLVTWKDVEVRPGGSFAGGGQVDLSVAGLQMPNVTYTWTQLSGPAVEILNANTATASFTTPNQLVDCELSFQINVSDGNFQINDIIDVSVAGNNALGTGAMSNDFQAPSSVFVNRSSRDFQEPLARLTDANQATAVGPVQRWIAEAKSSLFTSNFQTQAGTGLQKDAAEPGAFNAQASGLIAVCAEDDLRAGMRRVEDLDENDPVTRDRDTLREFVALDHLFSTLEGLFD